MPCGVGGCDVARALRASPSSMSWLLPVEFNMVGVWCDRLSRRRVGLCLRVGLCIVGTGLAPPSLADEGTDRSWSLDELLQFAEEHAPATAIARARVALFTTELLPGIDDTLQQLETAFRLGELDLTEVTVGRDQVLAARREALLAWRRWFEALSALEAEVGAEISSPSLDVDATTTTTTNPVRGAP